jgi:hypothetical protein
MIFGLVIRVTEPLKIITTSNNNTSQVYTVYSSLWHALSLFNLLMFASVVCFHADIRNLCNVLQATIPRLDSTLNNP